MSDLGAQLIEILRAVAREEIAKARPEQTRATQEWVTPPVAVEIAKSEGHRLTYKALRQMIARGAVTTRSRNLDRERGQQKLEVSLTSLRAVLSGGSGTPARLRIVEGTE